MNLTLYQWCLDKPGLEVSGGKERIGQRKTLPVDCAQGSFFVYTSLQTFGLVAVSCGDR